MRVHRPLVFQSIIMKFLSLMFTLSGLCVHWSIVFFSLSTRYMYPTYSAGQTGQQRTNDSYERHHINNHASWSVSWFCIFALFCCCLSCRCMWVVHPVSVMLSFSPSLSSLMRTYKRIEKQNTRARFLSLSIAWATLRTLTITTDGCTEEWTDRGSTRGKEKKERPVSIYLVALWLFSLLAQRILSFQQVSKGSG